MFKFWKKQKKTPGGMTVKKANKSGSNYSEAPSPQKKHLKNFEIRETKYIECLGSDYEEFESKSTTKPYVKTYAFSPSEGRPFYTYITSGMSDKKMNPPKDMGDPYARAELVFHSKTEDDRYAQLLGFFAHVPHANNFWVGFGHTASNGNPPEPLFDNPEMNHVYFVRTQLEDPISDTLQIEGDTLNIYSVIPISQAEADYAAERGSDQLMDLLGESGMSIISDPLRTSCI